MPKLPSASGSVDAVARTDQLDVGWSSWLPLGLREGKRVRQIDHEGRGRGLGAGHVAGDRRRRQLVVRPRSADRRGAVAAVGALHRHVDDVDRLGLEVQVEDEVRGERVARGVGQAGVLLPPWCAR